MTRRPPRTTLDRSSAASDVYKRQVDACGNSSSTVSQTITQTDTQAPVIGAAGANVTIECTATPSFTAPTACDACNTATVQQVGSDVTGGTACARTITRTWNAVDACGNTSSTCL